MRTSTLRQATGFALSLLILAAVLVLVVGCNTVKGVGRDVEAMAVGGQEIIDGKRK